MNGYLYRRQALKTKPPQHVFHVTAATNFIRGIERIRTAVAGFADLCLTTRPRYLKCFHSQVSHF